ncbi:ADP-ribosylglycohydrolase family protein [Bacteroides ovatus]|nr:ADP-ribosylglycohydrolase family protein [Bacteroides ovatus]
MRKIITICIIGLFALNVQAQPVKTLKLSDKELLDKIKGGWAGQTIGVVFGAPTEFKFTGTYIQDYQPIPWAEGYVKYWWEKKPGLFDDIYNDCTFVEAFDELGLDCSQEELAKDLHSLIIIWLMLTKQVDIISAKVSCHRLPVIG